MVKIVSRIKYPIEFKTDLGKVILKGTQDSRLIGDGITELSLAQYEALMRANRVYISKLIKNGKIVVGAFDAEKVAAQMAVEKPTEEVAEEAPSEKKVEKDEKKIDSAKQPVEKKTKKKKAV